MAVAEKRVQDLYYLAFNQLSEFINFEKFQFLVGLYGNPEATWEARFDWPLEKLHFKEESLPKIAALLSHINPSGCFGALEQLGISFISLINPIYPITLRQLENPPLVLYFRGNVDIMKQLSIAVVGTRMMTSYGRRVVESFVPTFVGAGFSITSGLAFGVDSYAHKIALENQGTTVAVLPSSLDIITPSSHGQLAEEMVQSGRGLLISEFPLGTQARRWFFPLRSRIVVALSQAVLVVEAAAKSGTEYAALEAISQKKPLFAVPGPVDSDLSIGTNALLAKGAKVAGSPAQVLKALGQYNGYNGYADISGSARYRAQGLEGLELKVFDHLKLSALTFYDLAEMCRTEAASLNASLTALEIKGMVRSVAGVYELVGR